MNIKLVAIFLLSFLVISAGGYFGYQKFINSSNLDLNNSREEKLKQDIENKNNELKEVNNKLEILQKQFEEYKSQTDEYKKQITSKESEISTLKKEISSKTTNLEKLNSSLTKQEACNKMNEYSQLSSELKFRYGGAGEGEGAGNGCFVSVSTQVSQNTENAYEYVSGWYDNYKKTGSFYFKSNPDLCLYDVEKLFSKLKDRRDKYREYKEKCE